MFKLEIKNKNGEVLACKEAEDRCSLAYDKAYEEGDVIEMTTSETNIFLVLQLDDAMGQALVYQNAPELKYIIPFNEGKRSYSPKSFYGDKHVISVRRATEDEIGVRRNLALNVYDRHGETGCYPHAHANVETRGESVFAARNAINGNCCNDNHGPWPYESWGINMQDDAEITLEFGRKVEIDSMVLVTRADFPHDNYWKKVTFNFSDGSEYVVEMEKSSEPHFITLPETKQVEWIKLGTLIKDENDPSPFPALTQWEVYGTEIK